jgi:hypothetical protein
VYGRYKIFKLIRMKKELKEVYANQLIENLAVFLIGVFIPVFIIRSGLGFFEAVLFMLLQYMIYVPVIPLAARLNARIGVKHTILVRAPVIISYLVMVVLLPGRQWLFYPAAIVGGISVILYWISMNTEYVRTSDKRKEGEEAGLLFGLPYLSAVIGPISGALILSLFGFTTLMSVSVLLIILSVLPLFLSSDYKGDGFRMRDINLFLGGRKALWYFVTGLIYTTDSVLWGLFVYVNFGLLSLGIAASFMGLGMVFFTLIVGRRSNTIAGRRRSIRIGSFMCMILWLLRAVVSSDVQALILSLAGGFIIMLCIVPLYADFAHFAKKNGPARSVAFREFWVGMGKFLPLLVLLAALPVLGNVAYMQAAFVVTGLLTGLLALFRE